MTNWKKQIPVNAIIGKATDLIDEDSMLRRNVDFLQTVARHVLTLCRIEGWDPEVDGWDPGEEEWAVTDIEHIDDFDALMHQIYDAADAEPIWMGFDGDEIPDFTTSDLGRLGDFSKFTPEVLYGS